MQDFRAIAIRSLVVKIHHSFLRGSFKACVAATLYTCQFGGVEHTSVDVASAVVRWALAGAKACR
eukprot:10600678-Lingulodinium_polyedra.AAC.1